MVVALALMSLIAITDRGNVIMLQEYITWRG
jgi:hypothetical protein